MQEVSSADSAGKTSPKLHSWGSRGLRWLLLLVFATGTLPWFVGYHRRYPSENPAVRTLEFGWPITYAHKRDWAVGSKPGQPPSRWQVLWQRWQFWKHGLFFSAVALACDLLLWLILTLVVGLLVARSGPLSFGRFGVRGLLVLMLLIAMPLGYVTSSRLHHRRQRDCLDRLHRLCQEDWQALVHLGWHPVRFPGTAGGPEVQYRWEAHPSWLGDLLGWSRKRNLAQVVRVEVRTLRPRRCLEAVAELDTLESLRIEFCFVPRQPGVRLFFPPGELSSQQLESLGFPPVPELVEELAVATGQRLPRHAVAHLRGWAPSHRMVRELGRIMQRRQGLTDAELKNLAWLPLRHLALMRCHVTDRQLRLLLKLRMLESLDLSGNPVTDDGVRVLVELPRLQRVVLKETSTTAAGEARLARNGIQVVR